MTGDPPLEKCCIMYTTKDTWTVAHDLALVYIALAYGTDHDLSDEELNALTRALSAWDDFFAEDVREVVLEALAVYLEGTPGVEVARTIQSLAQTLSPMQRRQALQDVMRIAEADGILLSSEQSLISALAGAWHVKALEQHLLDQTTANIEALPAWSLLHDLSLVYVILAHSTDDDLSDAELQAITERLHEWQPDLEEADTRQVLADVLQFYAEEPGEKALGRSIGAIKEALPAIQRLVVLDDLHYIARADGDLGSHARDMIASLAQAWEVSVRLNGHVAS